MVSHLDSLAAPAHTNGQAQATAFIHNIEELQFASIHRLVELEVDCSRMVRVLGSQ
jgi:hypothetical protein